MKRFILTGAPGAGKTALLRSLELHGHRVIEEAATDVIALRQAQGIAEPWTEPGFVDAVAALQKRRQLAASETPDGLLFFDRSPVCCWALARFLGVPPSAALLAELDRIARESVYRRRVFFVESLGFCTPTAARRIGYEESLRFGEIHRDAYRRFGYEPVPVAPGAVAARAEAVLREAVAS